jgi:endonuclease G
MDTVAAPGGSATLTARLQEQEEYQHAQAARRAQQRAAERAPAVGRLDSGEIVGVNDPVRLARRLDRVSRFLTGDDPDSVPDDAGPGALVADAAARLALPRAPQALLEKVINQPDFLAVRYLEGGHVAQRTVGRVVIRDSDGRVAGYGTGFLVSSSLLLTNHHVLPSADVAAGSALELDFQRSLDGGRPPVVELRFDPARFFVADQALDFAVVAVAGAPASTEPYGWCRLTDAQGTVVVGECVTIVQHPRGREKEVVLRENKLVDIPEQVLHYVTDTEPGSSGSPVFNDQWEVIALHHASVPDAQAGTPGGGFLNEGIRISRILQHLRTAQLDDEGRARVAELGTAPSPHGRAGTRAPEQVLDARRAGPDGDDRPGGDRPGGDLLSDRLSGRAPGHGAAVAPVTVQIPLQLTVAVSLARADGDALPVPPAPRSDGAQHDGAQHDGAQHDGAQHDGAQHDGAQHDGAQHDGAQHDGAQHDGTRHHGRRLDGSGATDPTPTTTPTHGPTAPDTPSTPDDGTAPAPAAAPPEGVEALAIDPDYTTRGGYDPAFLGVPLPLPGVGSNAAVASAELRYHHFSIVMHRVRRLALFTAVNIHGGDHDAQPRSDDRWILDPRLPRTEQTGAAVYADNALDRGHLVRRLDPAWGPLARAANDDTFHYTNSAPQHHAFNAGSTLWLGLEEYVLGTARRDRLRVSVVSGPVLAPDDPPYRGVLLPRQFYKVVAVVDQAGALVVTGYVLGQHAFLPSVLTEAAFGAYRTFQVPVAMIAALTGLDLSGYVAADPLGSVEATVAAHALTTYADIVLAP